MIIHSKKEYLQLKSNEATKFAIIKNVVLICQVAFQNASIAINYRKQTHLPQTCTICVFMNSWSHQFGFLWFSFALHATLLSTRARLHLHYYKERNCVEMKPLKFPWHNLERRGNIWNPQLLWLCTSCEKMDGFTDVPDRLINPVASASFVHFPRH